MRLPLASRCKADFRYLLASLRMRRNFYVEIKTLCLTTSDTDFIGLDSTPFLGLDSPLDFPNRGLDVFTGDELLSGSFSCNELFNGVLWEVEGKWVVKGPVEFDISANPSSQGGEEDEGVDDQAQKVVDIVDTFRLQEQPAYDKKQFIAWVKRYIKNLTPKLDAEQQEVVKKNLEAATKFLLSKLNDLQFFVGESVHDDGSLVFAYYKDGATDPTFLYFAHGLKEMKC
ncbi:hypothetical protein Cgig2_006458 [Carnegiea gigantea]|uniref:TCTP domain-containing protein n=1 Tax=Carnegiea gigantea TaxID=171969 RepID=A0A9Q1JRW8_9CARY|nr:hypothetical protein Cgig2_006458 [Carnegiea gigantea]